MLQSGGEIRVIAWLRKVVYDSDSPKERHWWRPKLDGLGRGKPIPKVTFAVITRIILSEEGHHLVIITHSVLQA